MKVKTLKKIRLIISKQFGIYENLMTPDLKIFMENDFDSLDILEFIILLEKSFKIKIIDSFNMKSSTIEEIAAYIDKNIKSIYGI